MTLWQIWWISLAIKTAILPFVPITPDEAYYMAWARHPAFSYLDHPPFVAWLMMIGLPLWKTALSIRWPGVIFSHLGFIPWFGILKRLGLSERAQKYWMIAVLLGPLTGLGSFVITPDLPLVFFWSLSMWALLSAVDQPMTSRWLILGISVGLGLLSKYMMVLFFPCTLLWFYWSGQLSFLKRLGPWLACVVSVLLFFPVIYWNSENHFASFLFQTRHGLTSEDFKWRWPLEFMGSQAGLINPLILLAGLWVLWQRPWSRGAGQKFLVVFSIFPFLFFVLTSFRARAEANWAVCAFPTFIALACTVFDDPKGVKIWEKWIKTGIALAGLFAVLIISHVIHPWLPIHRDKDHTHIMREWTEDIDTLKDRKPLYARSYQMAAFHSYYRDKDDEVFKLAGLDRLDFYDFLQEAHPKMRSFIVLKKEDRIPVALLALYDFNNPKVLPSGMILFDLIPRSYSASLTSKPLR